MVGGVDPHSGVFGGVEQLLLIPPVTGLRPGVYGALAQRFELVGHDQIHVEIDRVPEPVASGTGAERTVEAKQAWLGFEIFQVALAALKPLG